MALRATSLGPTIPTIITSCSTVLVVVRHVVVTTRAMEPDGEMAASVAAKTSSLLGDTGVGAKANEVETPGRQGTPGGAGDGEKQVRTPPRQPMKG